MRVNASTQNNNSSSLTTFSYSMYVSVYICGDEEYTFNVIGYNINIKSSFIRLSYVVIFDRSEWVILVNTRVCICTVRKTSYLSYICGSQNWFINSKNNFLMYITTYIILWLAVFMKIQLIELSKSKNEKFKPQILFDKMAFT